MVDRHRHTAKARAISPSGACGAKPPGYSSSMKRVDNRPSRQRGEAINEARNGRLWRMPSITKRSSASAWAAMPTPDSDRSDQLGDHRIVVHRNFAALDHAGVDARHAFALAPGRRRLEGGEPAGRGHEAARRILGVDARSRAAQPLHLAPSSCVMSKVFRPRRCGSSARPDRCLVIELGHADVRPGGACSFRGNRSSCPAASTMNSTVPAET